MMLTKFRPRLEALEDRLVPANPHFINASSSIGNDGSLAVKFKMAGLGDNETITISVTGDQSATFQWFNKGGNAPQGQPFIIPPQQFTISGDFVSGKNGQVTGTLTVAPPVPPQEFLDVGKPNWTLHGEVTYSNVVVSGGGDSASVPGGTATFIVHT